MRAFWSGEIAFGLVTIPVKLYTATRDTTPSFQQLHKECQGRISMVRRCARCERDVKWEEIGKGYEVEKGQYALFTKEELTKLEGDEGESTVEIAEFIDPQEVDPTYFEKSYWVGPGGKSTRGFELLRNALETSKRAAIAKVKLRTRTRLALLRPKGKVFALDTMRFADELVSAEEIEILDGKRTSPRESELALNLVQQLSAHFDPKRHPDTYRAAFDAALQEKIETNALSREREGDVEEASAATGGSLIDLAELLSRSLKDLGGGVAPAVAVANDSGASSPGDERPEPGVAPIANAPEDPSEQSAKGERTGGTERVARPGPKKAQPGSAAPAKAKRAAK